MGGATGRAVEGCAIGTRVVRARGGQEAEEGVKTCAPHVHAHVGRSRSAGVGWQWLRQLRLKRGVGAAQGPGPQEAHDARCGEHLPESHTSNVSGAEHLDGLRSMVLLGWKLTMLMLEAAVWTCVRGLGRARAVGCERPPSHARPSVHRHCYSVQEYHVAAEV